MEVGSVGHARSSVSGQYTVQATVRRRCSQAGEVLRGDSESVYVYEREWECDSEALQE